MERVRKVATVKREIDNCRDCNLDMLTGRCKLVNKIVPDIYIIPDFCPLPDANNNRTGK